MARLGSGQLGAGMLARVVRGITVITGRCCWTLDTALMTNVCFRVCPAPGAWPGEAATEWLMVAAALGATFLK